MRRVKKFMILELTICLVVGVAGDRCGVTINSTMRSLFFVNDVALNNFDQASGICNLWYLLVRDPTSSVERSIDMYKLQNKS